MSPDHRSWSERRVLTATRVALVLLWSGVILWVTVGSVPDSPLRLPLRVTQGMIAVSPQGWAFFTRNPREPVDRLYRLRSGTWERANYANTSPRNLFGVRRAARAVNVEMAALVAQAPDDAWRDCEAPLEECLAADGGLPPVPVTNPSALRTLCGPLVVERRPPVPWAWSGSGRDIHMPGRVLRIDVDCPSGEEVTLG